MRSQRPDSKQNDSTRKPQTAERATPVFSPPAVAVDPLTLQRAIADPSRATPADILALQCMVGNRAVTQLIQTKLTVGPVGDKYEREADQTAERVLRMTAPTPPQPAQRQEEEEEELQMMPAAPVVVQRQEEEEELQLKSAIPAEGGFEASNSLQQRLTSRRGGGKPLPEATRNFMGPRFGASFGDVCVHTDDSAAQMNRQLRARG